MIPSLGRIVHYILPTGQQRAAVIVRIFDPVPTEKSVVNLQVLFDGSNDSHLSRGSKKNPAPSWRTSVHQDPTATKADTWHEPERI